MRCWQKQREDKRDAEDEATTTVGTFELVDGTQVLLRLSTFSLGSQKYLFIVKLLNLTKYGLVILSIFRTHHVGLLLFHLCCVEVCAFQILAKSFSLSLVILGLFVYHLFIVLLCSSKATDLYKHMCLFFQNDSPALVWGRARPPPLGHEEVCSN